MDIYCKNTLGGLVPLYDSDLDEKKKLKVGEVYKCKVSQPRNYQFHKKFFALIKLVFDNQTMFADMETLRKELTIAAGYYTGYFGLDGQYRKEADSISFGNMEESDFSELYERIIMAVYEHFAIEPTGLKQEIERYF